MAVVCVKDVRKMYGFPCCVIAAASPPVMPYIGEAGVRPYLDAAAIASTGPWPQQLRRIVAAVVGSLRAHPAAAVLGSQRILYSDSGRDIAERALELLVRAGFEVGMACDIARHSMQTAVMLVTQQPGELTTAAELREGLMAEKRAAMMAVEKVAGEPGGLDAVRG